MLNLQDIWLFAPDQSDTDMNATRKVTIQGVAGCYHEEAARSYFGSGTDVVSVPCDSFEEMFDRLSGDASLLGIMAIENTIAGALLANHELLRKGTVTVVGEYKMRISHVFCALPGQTIEDLTEAGSHSMALLQCSQWLSCHPWLKKTETFDTAGTARMIADGGIRGMGAVCGRLAAQMYGLDILEEGIETNKRNFTRFLILADPLTAPELRPRPEECDKSSIVFTLPHTHGALSKILTIFSFYDINLSKIQSMPILGREWEYRFYVDLTFDSYVRYAQALAAAKPLMGDLKVLGEYKACTQPV